MGQPSEKPGIWPAVPPSLDHNSQSSFELDQLRKKNIISQAERTDTARRITPYLGLAARLSQVWFNRWTILLLLVLCRMLILLGSLNISLSDAQSDALAACTKVEDIGSTMASMPHYLSVGVNDLVADGVTSAVGAMVDILLLIITGIEALLVFIIEMYVGTYACLAAAFIHGGLDVAAHVTEGAVDFINDGITAVANDLTTFVGAAQTVVNDIENDISSIGSLFGANPAKPNLDISSFITKMKSIHVNDTQFIGDIVQLNSTIPTFSEAETAAKDAISIPFDMLKTLVSSNYGNWSFDSSVFPVAQKEALTFCSDNSIISDFFTTLFEVAATAKIVAIVILLIGAMLAMLVMGWWEVRRYHKQQQRATLLANNGFDGMDVVYIASRPITASVGIKVASKFTGRRQILTRWFVAYGTTLPAIFVLSLALAGFFSCFCQWIVLHSIQKEAPALEAQVGDFAGKVVTTLENVSTTWANDANGVILGMQNTVNKDVFGWVVNATTAVNNTLNTFDAEMSKGLNEVFGQTILAEPIRDIVQCLIGNKIDSVEKGLTWVHDNAHVTFPEFANDTFSVGAKDSITGDAELTTFLSSPSSVTTDEISGALEKVITMLHNSIVQEALISLGLLLVYIIAILIGVISGLSRLAIPDRVRGDGGGSGDNAQRFYTADQPHEPLSPRAAETAAATAAVSRFPAFGRDVPESAAMDDKRARECRDGGLAEASAGYKMGLNKSGMASPTYRPGHWRASSHAYVEGGDR